MTAPIPAYAVFSSDMERMAAADGKGGVRLFALRSGAEYAHLQQPDVAMSMEFSPDGTKLAAGSLMTGLDLKLLSLMTGLNLKLIIPAGRLAIDAF